MFFAALGSFWAEIRHFSKYHELKSYSFSLDENNADSIFSDSWLETGLPSVRSDPTTPLTPPPPTLATSNQAEGGLTHTSSGSETYPSGSEGYTRDSEAYANGSGASESEPFPGGSKAFPVGTEAYPVEGEASEVYQPEGSSVSPTYEGAKAEISLRMVEEDGTQFSEPILAGRSEEAKQSGDQGWKFMSCSHRQ